MFHYCSFFTLAKQMEVDGLVASDFDDIEVIEAEYIDLDRFEFVDDDMWRNLTMPEVSTSLKKKMRYVVINSRIQLLSRRNIFLFFILGMCLAFFMSGENAETVVQVWLCKFQRWTWLISRLLN
jgi:hypothetical protein